MVDHNDQQDLFAELKNLSQDQLIEFVEQLQNAVDESEARNDALSHRVGKLESDRETLRTRLESAC